MDGRPSPIPSGPTRQNRTRPLASLEHRLKEEKREWWGEVGARSRRGRGKEGKGEEITVDNKRVVGSLGWPCSCKLSTLARLCPATPPLQSWLLYPGRALRVVGVRKVLRLLKPPPRCPHLGHGHGGHSPSVPPRAFWLPALPQRLSRCTCA